MSRRRRKTVEPGDWFATMDGIVANEEKLSFAPQRVGSLKSARMKADLQKTIGFGGNHSPLTDPKLVTYINLKLAALGCPTLATADAEEFRDLTDSLLARQRETERLLADYQAPVDWRIQQFLDEYLHETGVPVRLPSQTFVLDRHRIARALSLPPDRDEFVSDIVSSYRVRQGVLHNPAKDRRTTAGVFHVAEGGLPIPDDKKAVPVRTFARTGARS